ncbi:MAG: hypothetical protein RL266_1086 [Bacteroidota bacterium]|jgi:uncharacterized damage-inducible protein DinB
MVTGSNITSLRLLNLETLERLDALLLKIDQKVYTHLNAKGNASVGQHVRHTLEFYQCLLMATDIIDYDQRKRDILIESSPDHARAIIREIGIELRNIEADRFLMLRAAIPSSTGTIDLPSSLLRELFYVLEHAIHHMALIRILVKDVDHAFELEDAFGVAYSTLAYREHEANG